MKVSLKKIFFSVLFNSSLFLILIIGIQNSSYRSKVNFFIDESVSLPVSFVIGISFISGSITGCILNLCYSKK